MTSIRGNEVWVPPVPGESGGSGEGKDNEGMRVVKRRRVVRGNEDGDEKAGDGDGAVTFWQWSGSVTGKVGEWGIREDGGMRKLDESGDLQCVMVF